MCRCVPGERPQAAVESPNCCVYAIFSCGLSLFILISCGSLPFAALPSHPTGLIFFHFKRKWISTSISQRTLISSCLNCAIYHREKSFRARHFLANECECKMLMTAQRTEVYSEKFQHLCVINWSCMSSRRVNSGQRSVGATVGIIGLNLGECWLRQASSISFHAMFISWKI